MAEVQEMSTKGKPRTWSGIQLFQLKDNPEWQKLINSGSLSRIIKKASDFIKTIHRIEEKTGEKVLDTDTVQARINELTQAAVNCAPKEGVPAAEIVQTFEALLVSAKALEVIEDRVDLNDPSGVSDVRALRKVVRDEERKVRSDENTAEEHSQDKSEEFSLGDLEYAILGEGVPRALYEAAVSEKEREEEAEMLRRRAADALPENLPDRDFLEIFRKEAKRLEDLFDPSKRREGWSTSDIQRSIRAELGRMPRTQPLTVPPPPDDSVQQLLQDLEAGPNGEKQVS